MIAGCMAQHKNLDTIVIALEATSVYSVHIANFLSTSEILMPYKPYVFCVNPKATAGYRKSYIGLEKTDPSDAFLIADFARVGRTKKMEPQAPYQTPYAPCGMPHQREDLHGLESLFEVQRTPTPGG